MRATRVLVAMSGGVDSSMAAAYLLAEGYAVEGVTFRLVEPAWADADVVRRHESAIERAARVCALLRIRHHVLDAANRFRAEVVEEFARSYAHGTTPNPCVLCNERIKFALLLELASERGFDCVATGHYARVAEWRGAPAVARAADRAKDQSYFLYRLRDRALRRVLFPLGNRFKRGVREDASGAFPSLRFPRESQEACFVAGSYHELVARYAPEAVRPGPIVATDGRVLGEHQGIARYTVGQRRGLGVAAGRPMYVVRIDPDAATVVVGEEDSVHARVVELRDSVLAAGLSLETPTRLEAQVRYRMAPRPCVAKRVDEERIVLEFDTPCTAPAPGQSGVMYDGDIVVGGGIIARWEAGVH